MPPARRRAFTIIELVIVVTVIALILAIAVPGLTAMNAEARLTAARQTINGVTTRAYALALANRNLTAVRFFPGQWDLPTENARLLVGRQHLAIYNYVGSTTSEDGPGQFVIDFREYFERAPDLESVQMPEDVWAAPLEALSDYGPDFILDGVIGSFAFNAERVSGSDGADFLSADDFLIVCDPQIGLRAGTPRPFLLRAYAPPPWDCERLDDGNPKHAYQRYSFSGVVTYRREPFVSLGKDAPGEQRQEVLKSSGRPYLIHRFGGGLLSGVQSPQ